MKVFGCISLSAKCPNCGSGWGQFKKVKYTPEGIFSVSLKPIEVSKKRVRLRPFRRFDETPILPVDDREKEK
jgi:hypothetical protein